MLEWFHPDKKPKLDKSHKMLAIDKRNGLLATHWTPEDMIKTAMFLDLPSRYADWLKTKGIAEIPDKPHPIPAIPFPPDELYNS